MSNECFDKTKQTIDLNKDNASDIAQRFSQELWQSDKCSRPERLANYDDAVTSFGKLSLDKAQAVNEEYKKFQGASFLLETQAFPGLAQSQRDIVEKKLSQK